MASITLLSATLSSPIVAKEAPPLDLAATTITAKPTSSTHAASASPLRFSNTPLNEVLDNLASSRGLIVYSEGHLNSSISLTVNGIIDTPALEDTLNTALIPLNMHVQISGRLLKVLPLSTDRFSSPVIGLGPGGEPSASSSPALMILPLLSIDPVEVITSITPLMPENALALASAEAQALILHGRQSELRKIVKIVRLIDAAPSTISKISVVPLRYSESASLAKVLTEMFSNSSARSATPSSIAPGGRRSAQQRGNDGSAPPAIFQAVGEPHANCLIMRGPPDLLNVTSNLITKLDSKEFEDTEIKLLRLSYADAQEMATVVAGLFPPQSENDSRTAQPSETADTSQAEPSLKKENVIAVADPRTNTLLVRGAASHLASIARVVETLDRKGVRDQTISIYKVSHADPSAVARVLGELFSTSQNTSTLSQPRGSALTIRAEQATASQPVQGFGTTR